MLTTQKTPCAVFADARLQKRFTRIRQQLGSRFRQSIPQATCSKGQTKGAYRFFNNERVQPAQLIHEQHDQVEAALLQADEPLLCISDTSELDYTRKRGAAQLGPLTYKRRRGMLLHTSMLVQESGLPCGLLNQSFVVRQDDHFGQSYQRRPWPIEQKESYRWLADFKMMQAWSQHYQVPLIFVADREADMMELFHARQYEQAHYVIRSQFNRRTTQRQTKLYGLLQQQPTCMHLSIEVTHPKTRALRTAHLEVRFVPVQIRLNASAQSMKAKKHLAAVSLFAVQVSEIDPPADLEQGINWVLLTSLPVQNSQDALRVIRIYLKRWCIERFHYLLKSGGVAIEELQLQSAAALQNAITTYSIVVMDIMKIKYAAEHQPQLPIAELGIEPQVCQVLYQYVAQTGATDIAFDPQHPPSAYEFCRVLGRLGGFIPSKRQPLPGIKILTRAWEQLDLILKVWQIAKNKDTPQ